MDITIVGVPFNGDGTPLEVENPAVALRKAGLSALLEKSGHSVTDLGDLPLPEADGQRDKNSGILNFKAWRLVIDRLAGFIGEQLEGNRFQLVLGGDCGILVGIAAAYYHRKTSLGLVFLDGHADFHEPQASPEGELADMELAILTGYGPTHLVEPYGKHPLIEPDNVAVFGIRSHEGIDRSPIKVFDSHRIAELGIESTASQGMSRLLEGGLPIWVNLDVDVLDPEWMPVTFPEPGGLSIAEVKKILQLVLDTGQAVGMSITCFHPNLDPTGQSTARLVEIIAEALLPQAS